MTIDKSKLESLPVTITLAGFAVQRDIYLNGKLLTAEKSIEIAKISPTFDWGYKGSGPTQLSIAILAQYLEREEVEKLYEAFKLTCIAQLPNDNFNVKIKLRQFILALAGYHTKPVKAASLVKALPLDMDAIHTLGFARKEGEVASDNIVIPSEKVKVVRTGENSYDAKEIR